jgi:hypothetical protein
MLGISRKRLGILICRCKRRDQSTAASASEKDYSLMLLDIKKLGASSKLLDISVLIRGVPIDLLAQAAVIQFKEEHSIKSTVKNNDIFEKKRYDSPNALSTILDSLLYVGSKKVEDVIGLANSDVTAAHLIGAQRLLSSCNVLYNDSIAKKSEAEVELNSATTSSQWQKNDPQQSPFVSFIDDRVQSRSDMKRNSLLVEQEFVRQFTQWILCMNSTARWHHTAQLVKDTSYKQTKTSNMRLIKNQIFNLHKELIYLKGQKINADLMSIGDVAMASFDAFRSIGKVENSVQMIYELVSAGESHHLLLLSKFLARLHTEQYR